MEIEQIIHRLRQWADAYPEDMFPPLSKEELATIQKVFPGFVDRASASMGRHMGRQLRELADELEKAMPKP
jgi:hypothetical protein